MSDIKTTQSNQEQAGRWKNLEKYPMWRLVVAELKRKVEEADKVINMIGMDCDRTFTQRDIAIAKKNAYLDLIELPDIMISVLSGTGEKPIENMDAFSSQSENQGDEPIELPQNVSDYLGIEPGDFMDDDL